jgi:hypothetical protein
MAMFSNSGDELKEVAGECLSCSEYYTSGLIIDVNTTSFLGVLPTVFRVPLAQLP